MLDRYGIIRSTREKIGPETEEIQNCATTADEIDVYCSTNFDCDDENNAPMLPLVFWKLHRSRFRSWQ
jgi:hypothetical protein